MASSIVTLEYKSHVKNLTYNAYFSKRDRQIISHFTVSMRAPRRSPKLSCTIVASESES